MKLAFIIQRYGLDIAGGGEYHCRVIAEGLARDHEVEVLTTTAGDYIAWKDQYPAGVERINGVTIRRFQVDRKRNLRRFKEISDQVFDGPHSRQEEETWMEENGPQCNGMVDFLSAHANDYDAVLIYSYRYWTAFHGLPAVGAKAILVPTAEEDPAIHLGIFRDFFLKPAAILFLTPEERALIQGAVLDDLPPSEIIGLPLSPPSPASPDLFCQKHHLERPFALYLGRVDRNKGCEELFDYMLAYLARKDAALDLVLAGSLALQVPEHPRIRTVGFLSEQAKEDALAAATCLLMPSPYESLSIVTLEAWRRGTPTLVNGHCKVLRGQTRRSGGGLFYENFADFAEVLDFFAHNPVLRQALGSSGQRYVAQEYSWETVGVKIQRILEQVVPVAVSSS